MTKNNYRFTVEITLKAQSDEEAYKQLLEQIRPLYGLCVETVGCAGNGKELTAVKFDKIRDAVLNSED